MSKVSKSHNLKKRLDQLSHDSLVEGSIKRMQRAEVKSGLYQKIFQQGLEVEGCCFTFARPGRRANFQCASLQKDLK